VGAGMMLAALLGIRLSKSLEERLRKDFFWERETCLLQIHPRDSQEADVADHIQSTAIPRTFLAKGYCITLAHGKSPQLHGTGGGLTSSLPPQAVQSHTHPSLLCYIDTFSIGGHVVEL
jgi:hypothetical protein